jgi:hypothetical protein
VENHRYGKLQGVEGTKGFLRSILPEKLLGKLVVRIAQGNGLGAAIANIRKEAAAKKIEFFQGNLASTVLRSKSRGQFQDRKAGNEKLGVFVPPELVYDIAALFLVVVFYQSTRVQEEP